jgi:hypothetical protein
MPARNGKVVNLMGPCGEDLVPLRGASTGLISSAVASANCLPRAQAAVLVEEIC